MTFLFSESRTPSYEIERLRSLKPNVVGHESLGAYLEQGLRTAECIEEQKVFMFKVSAARLNALMN